MSHEQATRKLKLHVGGSYDLRIYDFRAQTVALNPQQYLEVNIKYLILFNATHGEEINRLFCKLPGASGECSGQRTVARLG